MNQITDLDDIVEKRVQNSVNLNNCIICSIKIRQRMIVIVGIYSVIIFYEKFHILVVICLKVENIRLV